MPNPSQNKTLAEIATEINLPIDKAKEVLKGLEFELLKVKNPSAICFESGHLPTDIGNSTLKRCLRCQTII
jgi:hypothetical protein